MTILPLIPLWMVVIAMYDNLRSLSTLSPVLNVEQHYKRQRERDREGKRECHMSVTSQISNWISNRMDQEREKERERNKCVCERAWLLGTDRERDRLRRLTHCEFINKHLLYMFAGLSKKEIAPTSRQTGNTYKRGETKGETKRDREWERRVLTHSTF